MVCSPEVGNVTQGLARGKHYLSKTNKSSYYPRTRATIILLVLTNATVLAAMASSAGNITCEGNIARKPDRILPCMQNAPCDVRG